MNTGGVADRKPGFGASETTGWRGARQRCSGWAAALGWPREEIRRNSAALSRGWLGSDLRAEAGKALLAAVCRLDMQKRGQPESALSHPSSKASSSLRGSEASLESQVDSNALRVRRAAGVHLACQGTRAPRGTKSVPECGMGRPGVWEHAWAG